MPAHETNLFGIPVPSDDKVFLIFIVLHIISGIICTVSGIVAMLARKRKGTHSRAGKIYYGGMTALFITIIITSVMRWPFNNHLLVVGTCAYLLTLSGQRLAKNHRPGWTRLHTLCMGASFVLLMTGFYVDNGKNLPFWNQFPPLFFWIFPAAVGIPVIVYVYFKHPLNRKK